MTQPFDLEKHKAEQTRARDLGFDYAAIRHIILQANSDSEDGISVGRAIELIREIGLRAADKAVAEDRAAAVAWLREVRDTSETAYASDDLDYAIAIIERGGHRRKEHACTVETKISKPQTAEITDQFGRPLPLPDHHRECLHGQVGWAMCTCEELGNRDIRNAKAIDEAFDDLKD
jgi:hypothetical protein